MILEKIKGFFKPTLIKIVLTILFVPVMFFGIIGAGAGGGIITLAGTIFIFFIEISQFLAPFPQMAHFLFAFFCLTLFSYLISCFFIFIYHFQNKITFKILGVILVLLILFFPVELSGSSTHISKDASISACNQWCAKGNYRFCDAKFSIINMEDQTCTSLGVECPSLNCSEI